MESFKFHTGSTMEVATLLRTMLELKSGGCGCSDNAITLGGRVIKDASLIRYLNSDVTNDVLNEITKVNVKILKLRERNESDKDCLQYVDLLTTVKTKLGDYSFKLAVINELKAMYSPVL